MQQEFGKKLQTKICFLDKWKIVKKIGQNTMFGIPQQNTDVLPENWVLVQSHSDETKYYFWNVKEILLLGKNR